MKELETSHGALILADFEDIFKSTQIMSYNENYIEIPGVVIFARQGQKSFITRLLNPGVEFIPVEDDLFKEMINSVKVHEGEETSMSFESKTRPVNTTIVNLTKIKENFIFARVIEDSITINDIVFTNNEAEFHGGGMIGKRVYFVNFEQMARLKDIITI